MFAMEHYENLNYLMLDQVKMFLFHLLCGCCCWTKWIEWDTSRPNGTPKGPLDYSKLTAKGWKPKYALKKSFKYKWFIEHTFIQTK